MKESFLPVGKLPSNTKHNNNLPAKNNGGRFFYEKIILTLSLVICALLVIWGCTKSSNNNETTTQTKTSTSTETTAKAETTDNNTTNVADTSVQADDMGVDGLSTEKVVWGPGRAENHQQPTDPVMLNSQYKNLGARFILDDKKSICLTFDEGYENGFTPAILDTLKEKNVKAIFFVTYDFAKDNPKLIKRMIDEGHIVGNHTYRHYTMDEVDTATAKEEITFLHNFIKKNFNYEMTLFRFPKGEFSQSTLALAKDLGYKSVFWSFAYADWDTQNQSDEKTALNEITKYLHPGEIMLLHAVSKTNASILGNVIDEAQKQGYKFTTNV